MKLQLIFQAEIVVEEYKLELSSIENGMMQFMVL